MNEITKRLRHLLVLPVALLLQFFAVQQANAQNSTDVVFNPNAVTVGVDDVFNVNVELIVNQGAFNVVDVFVNFDPAYLEVQSITIPPGLSAVLPLETPHAFAITDYATMNSLGQINYGRFTTSTTHATTDQVLMTIQFKAIAAPPSNTTSLSFNTTGLRQTMVVEGAFLATGTLGTGVINISQDCTLPTATLSALPSCDGSPFDLKLEAATGTGPWSLVVNGTTYNNINVGGTLTNIAPTVESLFPSTLNPWEYVVENDNGNALPITVGTRIRSNIAGRVRGIRFFCGIDEGIYTGRLYTNDGTQLAEIIFSSVTQEQWVQANFLTPVAIAANTTYVVTVTNSLGNYVSNTGMFQTNPTTNGSHLTAPATTLGEPNGVYVYSTGFPTNTHMGTSYYVDMLFEPTLFTYNLTSVSDQSGCTNTGALQTLVVNIPDCPTLPVSLINFSAGKQGDNAVRLNWATASEQNNKGFEIRRSTTGQGNWQTIGFVIGAGESESRKTYTYLDENLPAGRYYYQLNQVDHDGRNKLSSIVSVNLGGKEAYSLDQNFPNPFRGSETNIRFTLPQRSQVQLIVYDMNGRVVKTLVNGTKEAGTHLVPFQDNSLPTGVYFYRLTANGFTDVKKMTIR